MNRLFFCCKIALLTIVLALPFFGHSQQLISSQFKTSFTKAQLTAQFGPFAQNGIRLYKIQYTMPDLQGITDTVSGLLIIPDRTGVAFPLLCAMHGTVDSKVDVPSNLLGGYELGSAFGALGYVAFMPDYLGLGDSKRFHPYVHAESEASAGINMLFAVREYAAQNNLLLNDQLFITGYSQGGHASMAMHQAIEQNYANTLKVTAAAHLSGPYSISTAMRSLILSDNAYYYPAYIPYTLLSYNLAYGLFYNLADIFKPNYTEVIQQFLNGELTVGGLNDTLITLLKKETVRNIPIAKSMFQDSILNAIANDPNHPINKALEANDTYKWAPQVPTRLYYCKADDQVTYRNSIVADSVMTLLGAVNEDAVDVNSAANHGECVFPAVLAAVGFFAPYQQIQTDAKDIALNRLPIEAFPNPADDFITFKHAPKDATLQIIDLNGKIRCSTNLADSRPVNIEQLPQGVYFARITSREGQWTGRIVLN